MHDARELQTKTILELKTKLSRGCPSCDEHPFNICESHALRLAKYVKYIRCGVPPHYISEILEGELIDKRAREFYLDSNSFSEPFSLYETVLDKYIDNINTKVIDNGLSFVFYSFNGAGKTHTAVKVLIEAIEKGLSGYYIIFKDLLNLYNSSEFARKPDAEKLYTEVINSDFLVIDEIGKESSITDNILGNFEQIIKYRTGFNKPTIMITNILFNHPEEGFISRYKSSVHNAILQNYRVLNFDKGGDFRTKLRKSWDL
jgi:hypothetical protein